MALLDIKFTNYRIPRTKEKEALDKVNVDTPTYSPTHLEKLNIGLPDEGGDFRDLVEALTAWGFQVERMNGDVYILGTY